MSAPGSQLTSVHVDCRPEAPQKLFDSTVIFSPFFWNFRDDMWQTTHHIAREFSRTVPTILVEPPVQWNPGSAEFRAHRLIRSVVGARTRSPLLKLTVFHRRGLPLGGLNFVRSFDLARNAHALNLVLKHLGFRRTLLWHSFPYWSEPLVEAINHLTFVYHCLDHCEREEERRLVRRADAVFCVSDTLLERHRQINPNTHLLPNGVDLRLFDACRAAEGHRPADLPKVGRLLGFLGYVNYHLDVELLLHVAKAFPRDYVIVVGRIPKNQTVPQGKQREALADLHSQPNVRILGFKPTPELPLYLNAFDVCLIPFLKNQFNRECDPLKFYQYIAMGKPVVSTPVVVAERYHHICYVAESHDDFIAQIARALREGDPEAHRRARLAVAQAHSWESLVAQACRVLSSSGGVPVCSTLSIAARSET